ncbi:dTDP-4-amino-4,6-dideoxygalactose transaminase [Thermonema lapsum]|uniref:dTDP-4-amino-4,6-dideoxygalactose transaminase n=1 Tax=Thermonema lapsum TaxID=28195 RepID=A0A846MT45_9BACT|nr:DegT/DnrJ/EryC1/StrS family aminotransferase [Thermonema lapsum]NIK74743.1 dTDP-4-amino-4,6-dideoxygalactose transaminase [Thermonema lapsum]
MRVPFFDLRRQNRHIKALLLQKVEEVLENGCFSGEACVHPLEQQLTAACGLPYVLAVNSGTAALFLALKALNIGKGDEVILPAHTYFACASAVLQVGAQPVFADIEPRSWQIDPQQLPRLLTPRTKAVLAVHLYGIPCDINAIARFCQENALWLIEDAAQAFGTQIGQQKAGSFGDMAAFSFYPTKNLGTAGEGGAIAFKDPAHRHLLRALRNQGNVQKYHHEVTGYNFRMGALEAAILEAKLPFLEEWTKRKQQIVDTYRRVINNPYIRFPEEPPNCRPAYHLCVIQVADRQHFLSYLKQKGIGYGIHYPVPCHKHPPFRGLAFECPRAEYHCAHCVSLPLFPELHPQEVEYVAEALNAYRPR